MYRPLRVIPPATETAYVPYKSAFMGHLYYININNNNNNNNNKFKKKKKKKKKKKQKKKVQ